MKPNEHNDSFEALIKDIQALPEPDYDQFFSASTQADIHNNLMRASQEYQSTKQARNTFKKISIGLSGLAACALIILLVFNSLSLQHLMQTFSGTTSHSAHKGRSPIFATPSDLGKGSIKSQSYPNTSLAVNAVESFEHSATQNVQTETSLDLGLGINAFFYQGKNYYKLRWDEGRWTILVSGFGDRSQGVKLATNIVTYLNSHYLPAPDQKGFISVIKSTSSNGVSITENTVARQVGKSVVTFKNSGDTIHLLQSVVNHASNPVKLTNMGSKKDYSTSAKATDAVYSEVQALDYKYPSGTLVDLGYGIQAIASKAANSYKYTWYEGRWTLYCLGQGDPKNGLNNAKKIVAYLHTHFLPPPDQKGVIVVTLSGPSNTKAFQSMLVRQVGKTVYTLNQTGDPLKALQTVIDSQSKK